MKTRLYTVHLRDDVNDEGLVLVKDGFSWPAFLISIPWALFHRMWDVALALVLVQVALVAIMGFAGLSEIQQSVMSLIVALAFGYSADELRRWNLSRRGYALEDVVLEQSPDRALGRFLDARPHLALRLAEAR